MKRSDVLRNPALASKTTRYHAWLTHQRQTTGEHSYNVLRIYSQVWKTLPTDTAIYIIWHDAGEWVSGDPPFPSKAKNPDLKAACDRIERNAVIDMGGVLVDLPEEERWRVKACDLIEMMELAAIEFLMGNRFALPVINDPKEALQALLEALPPLDRTAIKTYVNKQAVLFGLNELCM